MACLLNALTARADATSVIATTRRCMLNEGSVDMARRGYTQRHFMLTDSQDRNPRMMKSFRADHGDIHENGRYPVREIHVVAWTRFNLWRNPWYDDEDEELLQGLAGVGFLGLAAAEQIESGWSRRGIYRFRLRNGGELAFSRLQTATRPRGTIVRSGVWTGLALFITFTDHEDIFDKFGKVDDVYELSAEDVESQRKDRDGGFAAKVNGQRVEAV